MCALPEQHKQEVSTKHKVIKQQFVSEEQMSAAT